MRGRTKILDDLALAAFCIGIVLPTFLIAAGLVWGLALKLLLG